MLEWWAQVGNPAPGHPDNGGVRPPRPGAHVMSRRLDSSLPRLAEQLRNFGGNASPLRDLGQARQLLNQAQRMLQSLMRDSFTPPRAAPTPPTAPTTPPRAGASATQTVTVNGSAAPDAAIKDYQTTTSTIHFDQDVKL